MQEDNGCVNTGMLSVFTKTALHYRRNDNSHRGQDSYQFAANYGGGGQQKRFAGLIVFAEDRMMVVEGIEKLRQLESMLCQVRRLGGGDALINDLRGLGGGQPEFPDFVG